MSDADKDQTRGRLRPIAFSAAALVCALGISSAHAAPYAGEVRTATGTVSVKGSDGKPYQIKVSLQSPNDPTGANSPQLSLSLIPCHAGTCDQGMVYAVKVTSSAVTFDSTDSMASVKTTFAGARLSLSWNVNAQTSLSGTVEAPDEVGVNNPRNGGAGTLHVTAWGLSCNGAGNIEDDYEVSSTDLTTLPGGTPPTHAPKWAARHGRHIPRCAPTTPTAAG
ncbi:MAG TPA: hypothetical protein VFT62_07160 [Mycobacteriales bacterium]|nr:hypothetical protein [Mycobacteriales bacterium]